MRISAVSESLGFPPPFFVARLEEALEIGADRGVLFVDLGSSGPEQHVPFLLQTWDTFHPGTEIVLFTPLLDRDRELRVVAEVCRSARSAEVRVMTGSDFYRDEVWNNLGCMRERAALEAEFRTEFLAAVRRTGRPLRAEPAVLMVLHDAPRSRDIKAAPEMPLGEVRAALETERKALWRFLRRSGQLPVSWLLLIFRVLWYAKLRERGWSPGRIAEFLGFASSREFRMTIKRRFGLGLEQLKRVRYSDALEWAADLVTSSHLRLARQPVRALVHPLVDGVRVPMSADSFDQSRRTARESASRSGAHRLRAPRDK